MVMVIALGAAGSPREAPLRVLVLVDGDRERSLATRVEGQTTDLDAVIAITDAPPGADAEGKAAQARAEAAKGGSDAVVWFVPDGDGWTVNVLHDGETLRRQVAESSGAMSTSASTEAVALVVRTALRGLATGAPEPPPPSPPGPSLRVWGGLGWAGVLDGTGTPGHHGGQARLGVAVGPWRVALEAAYHPAEKITSSQADILVERQEGGVVAGFDVWSAPRWCLGVEFLAAVLHFPRVTTSVGTGYTATAPQDLWSMGLRPAFSASLRLVGALWVTAALGADVILARPQFGVLEAGVFRPVVTMWAVQPRASLTFVIDML